MTMKVFAMIVITLLLLADRSYAYDIKVNITSFKRSPKEQALVILEDYKRGIDLESLYKKQVIIKELLAVIKSANSIEAMTAIIERYNSKGIYLSYHMCGGAIDISKKGKRVKDFIEFMKRVHGAIVLDEGDHYHIQTITKCK